VESVVAFDVEDEETPVRPTGNAIVGVVDWHDDPLTTGEGQTVLRVQNLFNVINV
jgi:hypothetical protein